MSLVANIDHLAIASGIEAVVVDSGTREYRGDNGWYAVLDGSLDLFKRTDEKSIRLVVGKHTVVVQKEGEETVAVVLPTGHAIAKSLRRMIRRMSRKNRGPLPKPKSDVIAASAPPPTSTAQSTPPPGGQPSVAPVTKPAEDTAKPAAAGPSSTTDRDRGDFAGF